ncbi:hypothetical protein VR010_12945 [Actinomycetaceae bacterium L2_0104]
MTFTVRPSIRYTQGDEGVGSDDYLGGYEEYHERYGDAPPEGAKVDLIVVVGNENDAPEDMNSVGDIPSIDLSGLEFAVSRSGEEGFRLEFASDDSAIADLMPGGSYAWSWLYLVPSIEDRPNTSDLTVTVTDSNDPDMGTVTFTGAD